MALNAGGHDNITLHLFEISNSKYAKTIFEDVQINKNVLESTLTDIKPIDENLNATTKRRKILLISIFAFLSIIGAFLIYSMISGNKSEAVISTVPDSVDSLENNSITEGTSDITYKNEDSIDVANAIPNDSEEAINKTKKSKSKKEKKKGKPTQAITHEKVEETTKKKEKKENAKVKEVTKGSTKAHTNVKDMIPDTKSLEIKVEVNNVDSTKQNKDK